MNQGFQSFLKQWYTTQPASNLLRQEKVLTEKALQNLFGYFLIQLGNAAPISFLNESRIKHKVLVDDAFDTKDPSFVGIKYVKADLDFLPIANESTDVVFMPHTLELAEDPYLLLRQVDSMLVPQGHVVITGFNPYGCAVLRFRAQSRNKWLRHAHLVRLRRLKEWLEVLGYDIKWQVHAPVYCFGKPGSEQPGLVMWFFKALEWCEKVLSKVGFDFGNIYCLVAQKRVDAPKLVGKRWHTPNWMSIAAKGVMPMQNRSRLPGFFQRVVCRLRRLKLFSFLTKKTCD
ncbi:class I SAM-dependent methyltransferase [Thiomicrorhabdus aquaedulcis]|uniref:class I SAM-dependent methyltransferase n=1 Tax=Thiomicrorhabdus aquaedulcis TaxID=2211106 RepID=UPI000FD70F23|nr:methyltransferase domain-containing protein [Thiomicrorhabdus aquaedulcis]